MKDTDSVELIRVSKIHEINRNPGKYLHIILTKKYCRTVERWQY